MSKRLEPPAPKHTRRRFTENVSDSVIAESNDVWHSTRIDDSSLQLGAAEVSIVGGASKTRKGNRNPAGSVTNHGSSIRDPAPGPSGKDPRGRKQDNNQVVINQPTGHPFLTEKLQICGYVIRQPAASNELFYDVMSFRKKLADWLIENDDKMKRIETDTSKFLKALNAYLTEHFKLAMKPTKHKTELVIPSLLHCLLGIQTLQAQVIKIIMPLFAEAALSTAEEDKELVNTILNQLKWLPSIVEGQKFADSLMSIVDNAVFKSQSSIIKELPNILPAHLHPQVAEKLLEKFSDQGLQLNMPLMDCFAALEISEGFWSSIRNTAVDQMTNAPLRDIPAYFSFVFRMESLSSLNDVITTIREKVELISEDRAANNDVYQVEILEKIGFCITTNPAIVNVWAKLVKEDLMVGLTESIKKIDLIMLLACAEVHQLPVDVLKLLFVDRKVSLKLFSQMMKENAAMVNQLFQTISKILDSLTRSKDCKCSETVREMTIQLFVGLSPMEAQTLMGNMTSTLVNFPPCRDLVLSILTKLAEKESKKLLRFAPHLMGVLEHVMQFPGRQIKALMNILAMLSQTEARHSGEANPFKAEFSILLRKQLTHNDIKIRCFGVFGALATIRRMAEQSPKEDDGIVDLLKLAWSTVERDPDACCIFFDEVSESVDALPMDICNQFCEVLKTKFQKLWTLDADDREQIQRFAQKAGIGLVTSFDANRECSEDRLIMIFENQLLEMSPLVIPAHIRVLAVLENKVKNGELMEIDALLGCPLLFPEVEEYFDRDSMSLIGFNQRTDLGQYLVLAINFFRESVSAFVGESDTELKIKIWLRLENILKLQKLLVRHFESFPVLPCAYIADKTIGVAQDGAGPSGLQAFRMNKGNKPGAKPVQGGSKKRAPAGAKKSGKKKARREASGSENDDEQEANVTRTTNLPSAGTRKVSKVNLDEEIHPKKITTHLRRFDKVVFCLLRFPLRCEDDPSINFSRVLGDLSAVSQNPARVAEVEKFTPEILALLLVELKHRINDDRCKLDILSVKKILGYVCGHINSIVSKLADNEDSGIAFTTGHLAKLEGCLRLLIGLMTSYFEAIKKLDKEEKDVKIDRAIKLLARQMTVNAEENINQPSQVDIIANVSTYLGHFVSFIKDPTTALSHLKLLKTIHDVLNGHAEMKTAIDEAVRVYLRNEWKLPSSQVDGFLKIWLGTTLTPFKVIKHLSKKLLPKESDENTKIPNSSTYKACTDANFHVWYNAMFSGLSQYVHKNLRRRGDFENSIQEWSNAINIFHDLMAVTKKVQRNLILASALRNCRMFLESFNSGGAELLPKFWAESPDEAVTFCKQLQNPCRAIQHICEYSKKKADNQLGKSVPMVKRVLEVLIFRVREVLGTVRGGTEAFWIGNLQHRDLGGQRIHSQVVAESADLLLSSSDEDDGIDDAPFSALDDDGSDEENANPEQEEVEVLEAATEESDDD